MRYMLIYNNYIEASSILTPVIFEGYYQGHLDIIDCENEIIYSGNCNWIQPQENDETRTKHNNDEPFGLKI